MKSRKKAELSIKKQKTVSGAVTFLIALILLYFKLPAFNYKNSELYVLALLILLIYMIVRIAVSGWFTPTVTFRELLRWLFGNCAGALVAFAVILAAVLLGTLISSPLFRARDYSELLTVGEGDFTEDVYEISYSEIPMLDATSASELGKRALGTLSDIVSQFEVLGSYTQINYQGEPVRVSSLGYGNIFKWFTNTGSGLPGYVMVNMLSQEASVVRTEEGLRYSSSECLFRNINRYLRVHYPGYLFSNPHMEIDDDGQAYWICPRLDKKVWPFGGDEVVGVVVVNAMNGQRVYYSCDEIPTWVDQVYSPSLILSQYSYCGKYGDGFFNAHLGQRNVTATTEGYNFIALNDDVYLYTGITSAGNDEANIGFILCNLRTKETHLYRISGATEQSAQKSAEGVVQDMSYTATFPLLLNIADQPTYFMALKDSADLVKCYAMVNVQQYQIVATGTSVQECEQQYRAQLTGGTSAVPAAQSDGEGLEYIRATGTVEDIRMTVVDGTALYYIRLSGSDTYYIVSAADSLHVVVTEVGDEVCVFRENEDADGEFLPAVGLELMPME